MSKYEKFHGIMPPILTPMHEDGSIDESTMRKFVNFLIDGGVNAIIVNGTMGEFYALTDAERTQTAKIVINEVKGRIPVVVGTGHSGTKPAVELSKIAQDLGADAVQVMPPYYIVPTDDGVYEHYREIAKAIKIPMFVYNNPGTTKVDLSAQVIARLVEIDNIIGIKLSPGGRISPLELAFTIRELTKKRPDLILMIAAASLWFFGMELGISNGCVIGMPNVFPNEYAQIYKLIRSGKLTEARKLNNSLFELDHLATTELGGRPRYIHVYKTLLMWRKIFSSNTVRKPMMPIEEYRLKLLRSSFDSLEFKTL
jgi:4-hydroxy-tetrahydrodipicolinate synthase